MGEKPQGLKLNMDILMLRRTLMNLPAVLYVIEEFREDHDMNGEFDFDLREVAVSKAMALYEEWQIDLNKLPEYDYAIGYSEVEELVNKSEPLIDVGEIPIYAADLREVVSLFIACISELEEYHRGELLEALDERYFNGDMDKICDLRNYIRALLESGYLSFL